MLIEVGVTVGGTVAVAVGENRVSSGGRVSVGRAVGCGREGRKGVGVKVAFGSTVTRLKVGGGGGMAFALGLQAKIARARISKARCRW